MGSSSGIVIAILVLYVYMHGCKKSSRGKSVAIVFDIEQYRNTLPPVRLFIPMHVNTPYKNCVYN
jgi:hypothetical protein